MEISWGFLINMNKKYDLIVVGAGIVGLAHAYEARMRGLSVAVIEKNARCVGASIRNFGFVTVSGQGARDTWRRAMYARNVWSEIAPQAGIEVVHRGSWILCQRQEAVDVAQAFLKTEMGKDCLFFPKAKYAQLAELGFEHTENLCLENSLGLLYSPHELRVESRDAIPQLTQWLEVSQKVDFIWQTEVLAIEDSVVHTSDISLEARRIVVCPGAEINGLAKTYLTHHQLELCTLQMLRVRVQPGFTLPGSVMTDNSLSRYLGWSELPEALALKECIKNEMPEYLKEGIHLIAVQSSDGTLVVGDSHRYGNSEDVFASARVDELILNLLKMTLKINELEVIERWTGVYTSAQNTDALIEKVSPSLRVAVVTSGTGASTAFGLAKDNLDDWLDL